MPTAAARPRSPSARWRADRKWEAAAGSVGELAVQLAFPAVLAAGGTRVASGEMLVCTLIAFLLYLFYLIEPVSTLIEAGSSYQEGAAAISRIVQVERLATEPADRPERFHETTGGRTLVNGKDLRGWSLSALRSAIGYVEQDTPLPAGTLQENLLFAAPGATDNDIRDALARTKLDTLVEHLAHGLDTRLDTGTKPSIFDNSPPGGRS